MSNFPRHLGVYSVPNVPIILNHRGRTRQIASNCDPAGPAAISVIGEKKQLAAGAALKAN